MFTQFVLTKLLRRILKNSENLEPSLLRRLNSKSNETNGRFAVLSKIDWRKGAGLIFFGFFALSKCFELIPVVQAEGAAGRENLRKRFNFIADVVEQVAAAVVCIEVNNASFLGGVPPNGSGFIVEKDGLILTNAHVVPNRSRGAVRVKLQDGRTFPGFVEDVDVKSDLATVRIKAGDLPVLKLGSSSDVRPGEWVVAIGSPLSLSDTITTGVVSSTRRRSSEIGIRNREMEYLQTDASITFGNSGGPLVNLDGEAIGINCMKIAGGISFAIPIDYAKGFLKRTEAKRSHKSNFAKFKDAGVTVFFLAPDVLREMNFEGRYVPENVTGGLLVGKVVAGSPADASGLEAGDVVTHVNSTEVADASAICEALERGKTLGMTVVRNGVHKDIVIPLEGV